MPADKTNKPSSRTAYKYDAKYHDAWVFSLAIKGATDEEIAEAFGVSRRTIMRWSTKKDVKTGENILTSFGEARQIGKEQADAIVERKLFDLCLGYDTEEIEQIIDHGKSGEVKIRETLRKTKHIPPNIMAIMYWLNNRSRKTGDWTQKQEVQHTFGNEEQDVVIFIPDNGRGKVE